jgi:predicted enzyme related to lactoylglutathione lyase/ketosteroid isomerase-like protein
VSGKPVDDFIAAINSHSLSKLEALMTDDHTFIDAHGNQVRGKTNMLAGWKGYFEWFPDYKIEASKTLADGDTIVAFGRASGTFGHAPANDAKAHWELPASWRAIVKGEKIAVWQVYADTKIPFEIIERYAVATNEDRVQGFGGVFFKADNPKELAEWYDKHLGTDFGKKGFAQFWWREYDNAQRGASTTFGVFKSSSKYFDPSTKPFMFNFRVRDLESTLKRLKQEGVTVMEKVETFEYGKFGWIVDLEGNKIELWQPLNEEQQFKKK